VRHAIVVILVIVCGGLYSWQLGREPLRPEELQLVTAADALAASVANDARLGLPLFIHTSGDAWLHPVPVYGEALLARLQAPVPLQPRVLTVWLGTLTVALVYFSSYLLFRCRPSAVVAAVFVLLDPAFLLFSRRATADGIWVVPFLLAFLIGVSAFLQTRSRWMLSLAAASLAAAVYSQPSAMLLVLLLALTCLVGLRRAARLTRAETRLACAAAMVVLLPLLAWFAWHPSSYPDTLGRWLLNPVYVRDPVAWVQAVTHWLRLTVWAETYWDFFSPTHLIASSTAPAWVGVFLLPVSAFIVWGLHDVLQPDKRDLLEGALLRTILLAALVVPATVAAFDEPRAIQRVLVVVPLGALLATRGVQSLWATRTAWARPAVVVLLIAAVVQFSLFYREAVMLPTGVGAP
jgi:4-amino-4-deoxy-L-arabinose transferase-like glycosyltransferase